MAKILLEKKGKIAYIILNRPKVNAFDFEMVGELHNIWDDFRDDDNLWVAILTGAGNVFSAGFDIEEFLPVVKESSYRWRMSSMFGDKATSPVAHSLWKPIVGAFDGFVNGAGLMIAFGCDIRIATKETKFGLAEIKIGCPVEFAAVMTRYMPQAIVNEMLLTGKSITAERAYNVGLINKVVSREELMPEATAIANTVCEGGPMSARVMKELVHRGWDLDWDSALALCASMCVPALNSKEAKEGLSAFVEKRKPMWKGK